MALDLFHDLLSLVSRAESHKTGALGFALVIHQDVDLAHVKVELLESTHERVAVNIGSQVAHIDSLDLAARLGLVTCIRQLLRMHAVEAGMPTATATVGVGSRASC